MSDQWALTASNEQYRDTFAKSVVNFLSQYKFDGVMIDWYNPMAKDSENLIKVLDKFDEKFASTSFMMGISVPANTASMDAYNVPKVAQ